MFFILNNLDLCTAIRRKKNKNTDYKHANVYPQQNSIHCIFKRNAKYMFTTFVENKDL